MHACVVPVLLPGEDVADEPLGEDDVVPHGELLGVVQAVQEHGTAKAAAGTRLKTGERKPVREMYQMDIGFGYPHLYS